MNASLPNTNARRQATRDAHLTTPATESELLTFAGEWQRAEYAGLRQESIAAQNNQQTAMNWGLGIFSGTMVAGFALAASDNNTDCFKDI